MSTADSDAERSSTAGTAVLHKTTAWGIAATFIGTTIGAGYASGQEILQYFVSFGLLRGTLALIIAGALFFLLCVIVLRTAQRLGSSAIHDLVNPTGSPVPTAFADLTITLSLVGTLVIMLAGAGAALQGSMGLPPMVGAPIMAALCVASVLAGVSGLARVQGFVVPMIIVVAVGVSLWGILNPGAPVEGDVAELVNSSPMINQWWLSGVLYVAFNFQLAYAVLAPMGKQSSSSTRTLMIGAAVGAGGLVVMAGAIMFALTAHAQLIGKADLPMVDLAAMIGPWVAWVYTLVLLLAQFTTALSCLYGTVARLHRFRALHRFPMWVQAVVTAIVTTLLSGLGFSDLIGVVYPILGYTGLVVIAMLIITWWVHRRQANGRHPSAAPSDA